MPRRNTLPLRTIALLCLGAVIATFPFHALAQSINLDLGQGPTTTAKYRVVHAGEICDASHASTTVTPTTAASASTGRRVGSPGRRTTITSPTPPASAIAMNGASPESTAPGASRSAWKLGVIAHGAAVCLLW